MRWVRWQLKPHTYACWIRSSVRLCQSPKEIHMEWFGKWVRTREFEIASITLWAIPYEDKRNQP